MIRRYVVVRSLLDVDVRIDDRDHATADDAYNSIDSDRVDGIDECSSTRGRRWICNDAGYYVVRLTEDGGLPR